MRNNTISLYSSAIFLSPSGIPYPQESFQDEKVMGTDGYFAPETLLHREYGYKSDVW